MQEMKCGMIVYVYRWALQDCTNEGLTSKADRFLLVGPGIPEIFDETDNFPVLLLQEKYIGLDSPYLYAVPDKRPDEGCSGWMMGGNFIYSSDSRFRNICPYPIPVHDRQEANH